MVGIENGSTGGTNDDGVTIKQEHTEDDEEQNVKFRPFERYDETDMTQLKDLLVEFERLGMSAL